MTEVLPDDWDRLSGEWQATSPPAPLEQLRRRVRRQTRLLQLTFAGEALLTAAAACVMVVGWLGARSWETRLVVAGLAIFSARVWAFVLANRRGTWHAAGDTLEDYQALERMRRERRLAGARFLWRVSAAMLPLLLALTAWRAAARGTTSPDTLVAAAGAAYLVTCLLYGRRRERRLERRLRAGAGDDLRRS